ncbi:Serine/threonine-protein kinase Nek3 [Heterocephalus glaber]|uniref:Serine/threonine-protein kinase Nek3 n=1 Tax=Heterocephalus glaber TaxID=10181 RepID=G5BUY2_HETGA|nr:Serine/threonine-protein kinase Nek3 [Heterocephalus glaber]
MDNYVVLRVIGEGSFGRALLVQKERSNQMFAMKEIRLPKNVFLTQSGKVKLGDFGSARLLSNPMAFACTYVGTPYYVPPEIWENLPYNNKSDIWSLGCILYELCTLKHPFQANSWKNLILKICQGSIHPLPPHYSYELQYLIKQMFKRNPSQRPSATTLLSRSCLGSLIQKCLPPEIITEYGEQVLDETETRKHNTPRKKDSGNQSAHARKAKSPSPHRRQWETNVPSTVLSALENASILTSSLTSGDDRGFLKGPLSEETESADSVDGDLDAVILDPERMEPRLDEEDTDFEEDDESQDWVSELKERVGWQGMGDG